MPSALNDAQRSLYNAVAGPPRAGGPFRITDDDGCLSGPFNPLLYAPSVGQAVQALGSALRFGGSLPARTRELVICAVAAALDSAYEWYAHSRVALTVGIEEDELTALRAGRTPTGLSDNENAALSLTRELVAEAGISDSAFAAARKNLDHTTITELTVLVGYYRTLAGLLAVADVPAPADHAP